MVPKDPLFPAVCACGTDEAELTNLSHGAQHFSGQGIIQEHQQSFPGPVCNLGGCGHGLGSGRSMS